ncbi:MAG: CHAT domain-containing protein [Tepidiformaceae bacterium]
MPDTFRPRESVERLEPVLYRLARELHRRFSPEVGETVSGLYDVMLQSIEAAHTDESRATAITSFFAAIDDIPEVREVVGDLLDECKGPVTRSIASVSESIRGALPPNLEALAPTMAMANGGSTRSEPESAAPPTDAIRPPLTRFPDLDYPAEVLLGARTSLTVSLLLEPTHPDHAAIAVAIEDIAETPPTVELVLRAPGFDIDGSNTHLLEVSRDEDSEHRFVLFPREEGSKSIRVDVYQDGRRLSTLRRETAVVLVPTGAAVPVATSDPGLVEFNHPGIVAPDLELCIETLGPDAKTLTFTLHSNSEDVGYHHTRVGSVTLTGSPLDEIQGVYNELSKMAGARPATDDEAAAQERRMANLGRGLWERLFSDELKAAYWDFAPKIESLLITSDEPWIPWEIVKPFRFDSAGQREDAPYLCESFKVARWLSGPGPADQLAVTHVRPVAPAVVNLDSVRTELAYLEQLSTLRAGVLPDVPYNDRARVVDLFEAGDFSIIHFAAHGTFDSLSPDNSGISLTGGPFRPSDVFARFGGTRPRPLVFINACHGARMQFAFTGLGGWADRLVRQSRVAAFVCAAWEVNDRLALQFTEVFYASLLRDNLTLGESFLAAREAIRLAEPSNSSWLAYVLYADPGARAVVPVV